MMELNPEFVVIISAEAEWRAVNEFFGDIHGNKSPYGDWFSHRYSNYERLEAPVIFFQGGWGKVSAAGSAQYAISHWQPKLIVNIGTCGGFAGHIEIGAIVLADRTVIYDIFEQMGDPDEHIRQYSTKIDNSWIAEPFPNPVIRTTLVSADRDLFCDEIRQLNEQYEAIAGDWESGAIAWVAEKNHKPCLVLRGVSDLVSEERGEAYDGNIGVFHQNTEKIMNRLLETLPRWLTSFIDSHPPVR